MTFADYAPRAPTGFGRGNTVPRAMPPLWAVIHTSEGGETTDSAEGLARFIGTPATPEPNKNVASYHAIFDTDQVIPVVRDDYRAHGAAGGNDSGIHGCHPGRADQAPIQWHDPNSQAQLGQAAAWLADLNVQYGIPLVKIGPADLIVGRRGVCGHVDVTNAFHQTNHTDPGVSYPWDEVLGMARRLLNPPTNPDVPPLLPDGLYWRRPAEWPFRVAIRVYADASKVDQLIADNPEWGTLEWIKTRRVATVIAVVKRGDRFGVNGPTVLLERLRTSEGKPLFPNPEEREDAFYAYNGGRDREFHAGDAVSIPVTWNPPTAEALAKARARANRSRSTR